MNANKIIYLSQSRPSAISGQGKARQVLFMYLTRIDRMNRMNLFLFLQINRTLNLNSSFPPSLKEKEYLTG